ncbi:hypothetical protein [Stutzerimonas nitrititolerans]|mgnify:CR=1 FL=1|uniref:hypothetical protein n=1 Tax=Stutzerimonas nitrititolerans TaxID=2482751 RepID=UPI00289DED9E|nr:hypothetical protein [Stutzerimonas nitrititolerans]
MTNTTEKIEKKLTAKAHILCGWPLILVAIGGAIGGGLGAAAYALNVAIYRSSMSRKAKITQNILSGLGAFVAWLVFASVMTALGS